jgi:ribosome-associated translation inhibitor RaiA
MQRPLDILFRDMAPSAAVEAAIERWAARLEHLYGRIQSCAVIVEQPHHHHRQGNRFRVQVDLGVPGREIATRGAEHENAYVAISEAFRAARRQLQDHARIQRGEVKRHVA